MNSGDLIADEVLRLGMLTETDKERFFFLESDIETNRYIKIPLAEEKIEEAFSKFKMPWSETDGEYHGFAVRKLDSGKLLGMVFYRYRDKASEIVEIGWKFHFDSVGYGYPTRAARLLMKYLQVQYKIHKFVAHCDADNKASERIMQKLGMLEEGHFKSNFRIGDTWRDEKAYGVLVQI